MELIPYPSVSVTQERDFLTEYTNFVNFQFAFGRLKSKNKVQQLHYAYRCRDYLMDVVTSDSAGYRPKWNIWFDPKKTPLDKDKCRLIIFVPASENRESLPKNFPLLTEMEKEHGLELSTVTPIPDEGAFLVEGDANWMNNSIGMSLYALLLRICGNPQKLEVDTWQKQIIDDPKVADYGWNHDGRIANPGYVPNFPKFIKNLGEIVRVKLNTFSGYSPDKIYYSHGCIGFCSFDQWLRQANPHKNNSVFNVMKKILE